MQWQEGIPTLLASLFASDRRTELRRRIRSSIARRVRESSSSRSKRSESKDLEQLRTLVEKHKTAD